jgi:pimeloyl-ACP methyl ester carboxylesterase
MSFEQPKTYVLVHGAAHGGWCWRDVAARLRMSGHVVYTPTLTGLGERSHLISFDPSLQTFIEDVAQVIRYEELSGVILVGHSYAGAVITGVADQFGQHLRHLVYLDAMILKSGECAVDTTPPGHIDRYHETAYEVDGVLCAPNKGPEYLGVTDPAQAEWLLGKLSPHPFRTFLDRLELTHELGNNVPATYIAAANPVFPTTARSREIARAMPGWNYMEIPCGHNAMMLMPGELAEMLLAIG